VAGVNLPDRLDEAIVLSPHPGAVLLSLVLQPLLPLGLARAEATLLQPISVFPAESLDQLFEQARGLLAFQKQPESVHWRRQLAFNLQSAEEGDAGAGARLREEVAAVLGGRAEVTAALVQAGVFHGFGASIHLAFAPDPGIEAVRDALAEGPRLRWADQEALGPVDVAGGDEVLLGPLRADRQPGGSYWLWAVMDNLTRGGASNALAIAEALLG
jgi:aspartate-semialdehyde dehydrogenase